MPPDNRGGIAAPPSASSETDVKIRLVAPEPRIVAWTDHAIVKANLLGIARADIEDAVLTRYHARSRNTGAADWLLVSGRTAIAYNYPAGDELTALIVTVWRRS